MFGNYKRSDSHHTHLITTHEPACVFSCQCLRSRATTGLDALPPVALLSLAPSLPLSLPPSLPLSFPIWLSLSFDGWMAGPIHGPMGGWVDGWLAGWMDEPINTSMHGMDENIPRLDKSMAQSIDLSMDTPGATRGRRKAIYSGLCCSSSPPRSDVVRACRARRGRP